MIKFHSKPQIKSRPHSRAQQETYKKFQHRTQVDPSSECILWTGPPDKKGYGVMRAPITPSGIARVHRVSFWLFRHYLPSGIDLDHTCRNKLCVNPYHLEPLTHKEHSLKSNDDRWTVDRNKDQQEP